MNSESHVPGRIDGPTREDAEAALDLARREMATGSIERAWEACRQAASIGRRLGDPAIVADAAVTVAGPLIASPQLTAARQALCLEALALLDRDDVVGRRRVEAHLRVVSTGWAETPSHPGRMPSPEQTDTLATALHAEHAARMRPDRAADRLETATRLKTLGLQAGRDDHQAWGSLWRMDALAQLGRRVELNAEFIELSAVVRRLDSPRWSWRVVQTRACLALLDDHIDDVAPLAAEALRVGLLAGTPDAPFLGLVLRSDLAMRTGEGLPQVEREVRQALVDAPFFAQSWHARVLTALGRDDEAIEIWRALAPHIEELPSGAVEWLVATTVHAELSILADDAPASARVYDMLSPYAGQQNMTVVLAPYGGPISLTLGHLARHLRRDADARAHYTAALAESRDMHAPWYSHAARTALSALEDAVAQLTRRESEVAALVAEGLTNREIAARLFLSERTVESHVSNALRRLGLPNRAAVAARFSRRS